MESGEEDLKNFGEMSEDMLVARDSSLAQTAFYRLQIIKGLKAPLEEWTVKLKWGSESSSKFKLDDTGVVELIE